MFGLFNKTSNLFCPLLFFFVFVVITDSAVMNKCCRKKMVPIFCSSSNQVVNSVSSFLNLGLTILFASPCRDISKCGVGRGLKTVYVLSLASSFVTGNPDITKWRSLGFPTGEGDTI